MSDLTAWCAALTWSDGKQTMSLVVAPDMGGAAAMATLAAVRSGQAGDAELTGCMVVPLPTEWMRQTLRTIEGGAPALSVVVPMTSVPGRAAGGKARAAALSPERRSEIAKNAAEKRWHGDEPDGAA